MKKCALSGYCFYNKGNTAYWCILGSGFIISLHENILPVYYLAKFNRYSVTKTIRISFDSMSRDVILARLSDGHHYKINKSGFIECLHNYLKYAEMTPPLEHISEFINIIKKA